MSTIAAISTAPAIGGIGIVRLSGDKCFEILDKILYKKILKALKKLMDIELNMVKSLNQLHKR